MRRSIVLAGSVAILLSGFLLGCGNGKPSKTAKIKSRDTTKATTQTVLRLADAVSQGGQVAQGSGEVGPSGSGEGYLGALAQANRSARASISTYAVQQAMQMYDIQNNGPIKTYEEFMENIIKPGKGDGINLPQLPYYQENAFDEASHELVVVEFPKKKADFEKQK